MWSNIHIDLQSRSPDVAYSFPWSLSVALISLQNTLPHTGGAGPTKTTTGPNPQRGEGTRHVTMTLVLTSGSNHTRPPPHRRGGANQKDHRPHSTGGGGDEAKQDQPGKATRPNKTNTHLTGKGGYHGVGGGGGVWQPCIIYIYISHIYIYTHTHTSDPYIA